MYFMYRSKLAKPVYSDSSWISCGEAVTNKKQKNFFWPQHFYTTFEQKCSNLRPVLSITFPQWCWISKMFGHLTLGSGGKKTIKQSKQMKKICKKLFLMRQFYTICEQKSSNLKPPNIFHKKNFFCHGDFTPLLSKKILIWDNFFSLLFFKDSKYLKSLDIGLWEVGAIRSLNGVNKVWRTDKHRQKKNK